MYLYFIVLAAATLVAGVDSAPEATGPKTIAHGFSPVFNDQNHVPTQRFLRTSERMSAVDEERVGLGEAIQAGTSKFFTSAKLKTYLLEKKTALDVLKKIKLEDDVGAALKNAKLRDLMKYIEVFNKKHPDKKTTLAETLAARYGDDALAKAIVSAERRADIHPDAAKLAQQLRTELLSGWVKRDQSVGDVFNVLKLREDGYEALTSRKLTILNDYITTFNREKGGEETLLKALTTGFGGESELVTILASAKLDPRTAQLARNLEGQLIGKWLTEYSVPANVLRLLRLDNSVDDVLKNGNLKTFEKYLAAYNEKNPNSETTLIGVLTSKYGEIDVARALVSGTRRADTERLAKRLQKQQLEGWLKSDKSADDVFQLLEIKNDNFVAVFISRKLDTLSEFIALSNSAKSAHETLIGVLSNGFGESKLAAMLLTAGRVHVSKEKAAVFQNMQFRKWVGEDIDSTNVFIKIFGVAEADASSIQKEVARQFKSYLEKA